MTRAQACSTGPGRSGAPVLEPVDGAHPGPGQRVVEDPFGVDPDVRPVRGARGDQPGQVPQRVPGLLCGQIRTVGGPATGWLPGMGFDQPPRRVVELHQLAVGARVEVLADPLLGQRVQRLGDLGVEVAVHLDPLEHRHVIGPRHRQQTGGFGW